MDPEKIYRSLIENSSLEPPSEIWEGIQDQLDIDMVWSGVESNLPSSGSQINWVRTLGIAASLLILVSAGTILLFLTGKEGDRTELADILEEQAPLPPREEPPVGRVERVMPITEETADAGEPAAEPAAERELTPAEELTDYKDLRIAAIHTPDQTLPATVFAGSGRCELRDFTIPEADVSPTDTDTKQSSQSGSLYFGLTGQLANTWMVNNKTVEALKSDDLTAVNASYGMNIGVHAGANIGQRMRLRSDFMWLSQSRQSYNEYLNGKYVTTNYELNYYTLSLQAGYRFNNVGREHYVWAGSYIGFMRGATRALPGITADIRNEFSDLDYGVMAGYDYPLSLGYSLTITPGVSFKYGLKNVFQGNDYIPWYLSQTRNAAINFSLSISYSLF